MAFSSEVKKEICKGITDHDKKYACLYGMILFAKKLDKDGFVFQTESRSASEIFERLVSEVFCGSVSVLHTFSEKFHIFKSANDKSTEIMLRFYKNDGRRKINLENIDNNNIGTFIAGAFLSCGSVTDPNKEYHLEFAVPEKCLADDLCQLLDSFGMKFGCVQRKNAYIVYIKGSEGIEDIITFMGAQSCTLDMINVKILKDVKNRLNRISNCESANYDRTIKTANRQLEDILLIESELGIENISPALKEIAVLRIENPQASLKELGEMSKVPIGRSGVNHRLSRLSEIAEKLRNGEEI